jgi:hypothetical protein
VFDRGRPLLDACPTGRRPLSPRTEPERAFLALGYEAERYLPAAAAQGTARLHERIDEALGLASTRGEAQAREALAGARVRPLRAAIWRRSATRSAPPRPRRPRRLSRYGSKGCRRSPSARSTPTDGTAGGEPLDRDLEAGLRRLKLRRVRKLAPELLQTARTQRWRPEELLATGIIWPPVGILVAP